MKTIYFKLVVATLLCGMLFSCSVKQYQQPQLDLPASFRSAGTSPDTITIARVSYRDFYKDSVLVNLIDKALMQNNDLKVAVKQIEFAALAYSSAKWGNIPTINAVLAGATISRPSDNSLNGLMASQFLGQRYIWDFNSSLSFSWEADIWGRIGAMKEDALAGFLQTQEAAKAVRTRLVAEVVTAYYNLLMLDKQLAVSQENLGFADSTYAILKKQQELGMITILAVQQQEMVRDQIAKSIPALESAIAVQENAVSMLTGSMPERVERQASLDAVYLPEATATGIPSELLSYRPDVRSSELELRRSMASVHIAKVSMYPVLNITAQGGLNAFKESNWFNVPGSLFGLLGGSIAQPILNSRKLRVRYQQAQVATEQAEIKFKQSVLLAVGEVSDALIRIEKLKSQQVIAQGLVQKAEEAANNALTLYKYNGATYIEVILAQSARLQAELDLATIKAEELIAVTALYRALGGGWQ